MQIASYKNSLFKEASDLTELTFILNTITEIWASSEDTERQYHDIAESYRTLLMYNIDIDEKEVAGAYSLSSQWEELLDESKKVDQNLVPVKVNFAEATQVILY